MNHSFQFRAHPAPRGEILTQPATFLPGKESAAHLAAAISPLKLTYWPVFRHFLTINPETNMMARPLLKGGLQ